MIPPTPMASSMTGPRVQTPGRTAVATQSQDEVPAWLDKAIVGVIVGLVVMLLKKFWV